MNLEEYTKQVQSSDKAGALDRLARSEAGAKLAARLDGENLEKAARAGDMQALSSMLKEILATPEGKNFAAQVQKAVKKDGR